MDVDGACGGGSWSECAPQGSRVHPNGLVFQQRFLDRIYGIFPDGEDLS